MRNHLRLPVRRRAKGVSQRGIVGVAFTIRPSFFNSAMSFLRLEAKSDFSSIFRNVVRCDRSRATLPMVFASAGFAAFSWLATSIKGKMYLACARKDCDYLVHVKLTRR